MKECSVCFFLKDNRTQVLLALKKRGFAKGKYDGPGGKFDASIDKNIQDTTIRESIEEVGFKPIDLKPIGIHTCFFPNSTLKNTVFVCENFEGEPTESEEMKPYWFKKEDIPIESTWEDFKLWYNDIFDQPSTPFNYHFHFDENDKLISFKKIE
eukprot:gene1475-1860_t